MTYRTGPFEELRRFISASGRPRRSRLSRARRSRVSAQERDRSKIPDQYKWNLADIYPSDAAWRGGQGSVRRRNAHRLDEFKGKLTTSPRALADALDTMFALDKELSRLCVYASLLADQDTRDSQHQGMQQEMTQLAATFGAQAAFIEPEILKAGKATIEQVRRVRAAAEGVPRLPRRHRCAARRTRSPTARRSCSPTPGRWPSGAVEHLQHPLERGFPVSDRHAERRPVGQARSGGVRRSARAAEPRRSREGDVGVLQRARQLQPHVRHDDERAKCRRCRSSRRRASTTSSLETSLDGPNIPASVYTRLIDGVNKNLPTFHRYLKLRKRMMGVDELHYYDLYAPLVVVGEAGVHAGGSAEARARRGRAARRRSTRRSIQRAFNERWIDLLPNDGQALGRLLERRRVRRPPVHADQLQRQVHRRQHARPRAGPHDAELLLEQDAAVSAGELSDLRRRGRVDVQRVAADRLHARSRSRTTTRGCRCSATTSRTSRARCSARRSSRSSSCGCTRWRRRGSRSPATSLAKLYLDITKRYYGHDQGICIVDDYVAHEWSYIPHFYRDFYVFQYATSFTASEALAAKVKTGDAGGDQALSGVSERRRIEVSDRPAEGRRRRHDDRRAARSHGEGDEPGDGRNGDGFWPNADRWYSPHAVARLGRGSIGAVAGPALARRPERAAPSAPPTSTATDPQFDQATVDRGHRRSSSASAASATARTREADRADPISPGRRSCRTTRAASSSASFSAPAGRTRACRRSSSPPIRSRTSRRSFTRPSFSTPTAASTRCSTS